MIVSMFILKKGKRPISKGGFCSVFFFTILGIQETGFWGKLNTQNLINKKGKIKILPAFQFHKLMKLINSQSSLYESQSQYIMGLYTATTEEFMF